VIPARLLGLGAIAAVVVVLALILFGGDGTTKYRARFQTATLLVKGGDVQIGGRRVGSVEDISLTDDNQAEVTFALEDGFAPLHDGTTAIIRATSLSGVANRYLALTPGPNNAPELRAGSEIPAERTTSPVSIDQLFNIFDDKTRKALQNFVQGQATWYQGKGKQTNATNRYFSPALSTSSRVFSELARDQDALTRFVVESSKVVTALAERRDDLSGLVGNASTSFGAIASENAALGQALDQLPDTLRKANTTFVNLRGALGDLDGLVDASKPLPAKLTPFLRELRPLLTEARPTLTDLELLIRKDGAQNDFTDIVRQLPRLQSVGSPTFERSIEALRKTQPVIDFIRPYTPDLIGFLRDFGQGASNYDANGHFARVQPVFDAFKFTGSPTGGTLTAVAPGERFTGLETKRYRRCPGGSTQAPADGSAPFLDKGGLTGSCDPTQVPPGP